MLYLCARLISQTEADETSSLAKSSDLIEKEETCQPRPYPFLHVNEDEIVSLQVNQRLCLCYPRQSCYNVVDLCLCVVSLFSRPGDNTVLDDDEFEKALDEFEVNDEDMLTGEDGLLLDVDDLL